MSKLLNGFNNGRDTTEGIGSKKPITQIENSTTTEAEQCNLPVIIGSTYLRMKQDWITPYNAFTKGTYATAEYWASKLGKQPDELINDFNNKCLDQWFEVYYR